MARKSLMALASLTLAASVLAGCGTSSLPGVTQTGNQAVAGQSASAQRLAPPKVDLTEAAQADSIVDLTDGVDRARRIASDSLYRYDGLLRDWERAYSDYEKDRIEERMLTALIDGLKDAQRAVSSGYGYQARQVYDIADRALDRYDDLRSDWRRAYSDRERREIVNDMLVTLTGALKDIKATY